MCLHQPHQPVHALLAAWTQGRDDGPVSQPGAEGFERDLQMSRINAHARQDAARFNYSQGVFKRALRSECFNRNIHAAAVGLMQDGIHRPGISQQSFSRAESPGHLEAVDISIHGEDFGCSHELRAERGA